VARIDFAHGRITTTAVPALRSGGPVSFLVGPDRVVIRPLEAVPGYGVPDGEAATEMTANSPQGSGAARPGPDVGVG
jgi:hypothetical protein